jgi:hypothetical protein
MSASFGQELTAGVLYEFCKATDEVSKTACRFYMLGVVQGVSLGDGAKMVDRKLVERKKTILCAPDDMPVNQMVSNFVQQPSCRAIDLRPDSVKLGAP